MALPLPQIFIQQTGFILSQGVNTLKAATAVWQRLNDLQWMCFMRRAI